MPVAPPVQAETAGLEVQAAQPGRAELAAVWARVRA
jgi:hypothetical protein